MIQLPQNLQVQIGEAVSVIASSDFPDRWQNLIPSLVSKLSEIPETNNGVLTVAHSIFKRWRPLFRSEALFIEIKLVLDQFTSDYLKLLQLVDRQIQENQNNKQSLTSLFKSLDLLMKIFYDFNCQDLPEFFEDNLNILFEIVFKYLSYDNPILSTDDDNEIGPIERVKTSICELLKLYTIRYEDVFSPLLSKFVEVTWNLLTTTSVLPKYDLLISKALSFLTSVAALPRHSAMFSSTDVLQNIIKCIILPNVTLQESDEEMFEDDPIEFIRRDLEGSDSDTRRRSATDFLRELNDKNQKMVTEAVMTYVNQFLAEFASNSKEWKQKDTAIYLFSAISVKGLITAEGVRETNPLVDVVDFFAKNVASDLVRPDVHPILKVDSIKYIHNFRTQLTKAQLVDAFPLLSNNLLSSEYVVYTYAAITIERILAIRDPQDKQQFMFKKEDIAPVSKDLLSNLFTLIMSGGTPEKLAENEFLMKCVMRILVSSKESIASYADALLKQVIAILGEISKNPSNPTFSHYTFEVIGAIIKYSAPTLGASSLESIIFPGFLHILGQEISEYVPYVFQIFALLLHYYPKSATLSDNYKNLIRPLMSPTLWELRGNIPGLVSLLQSILRHGSKTVIETENLQPYLGVFQKLISSKANEGFGLALLQDIIYFIPTDSLSPFTNNISYLIMQRLQSSRTDRFVSRLALLIYFVAAAEKPGLGPDFIIQLFDSVQNGIFGQIFGQFILPATTKISGLQERKISAIGLTKIITLSQKFISGEYNSKWTESLVVLVALLQTDLAVPLDDDSTFLQELDKEESLSFGSTYSQLAIANLPPTNPAPAITNPKVFFISQVKNVDSQVNGQLTALISNLPDDLKKDLVNLGFQ